MRLRNWALCFCLAIIVGMLPLRAGTPSTTAKDWISDPNYTSSFGAEQQLGPFAIRLPDDFQLATTRKSSQFVATMFYGPSRGAGVHAFMLVSLGSDHGVITPDDPRYYVGTKKLFSMLRSIYGKKYSHYVQSTMQRGIINGMTSERAYFKAHVISGEEPLDAHGMYYVVDTGKYTAIIMAADTEPFTQTTLPMLEASCLTVRPNDSFTPDTNSRGNTNSGQ